MKLYEMYLSEEDRIPQLVAEKSFRYSSKLRDPEEVMQLCNTVFHLSSLAEERAYLIALDNQGNISGTFLLSKGTVNSSLITPREVMQRLLMVGASSYIVVHNHPSGNPTPSKEDKKVLARLKEASKIMGIQLADFMIVGVTIYYSAHENGDLEA